MNTMLRHTAMVLALLLAATACDRSSDTAPEEPQPVAIGFDASMRNTATRAAGLGEMDNDLLKQQGFLQATR